MAPEEVLKVERLLLFPITILLAYSWRVSPDTDTGSAGCARPTDKAIAAAVDASRRPDKSKI